MTGWDFARELREWGPDGVPVGEALLPRPQACGARQEYLAYQKNAPGLRVARAYCAYVTRAHYENFTVASLLLPRRLVPHFHAVYAYCRWSDDLADETAGGAESLALLDWWRGELLGCYGTEVDRTPTAPRGDPGSALSPCGRGQRPAVTPDAGEGYPVVTDPSPAEPASRPPLPSPARGEGEQRAAAAGWDAREGRLARHPVMVALRETIRRFDIPPEPFLNLLVAFTRDQHVKRYDTFDQLLDYCRNSANPVGHLVLYLFGAFDARRAALADEVCTGLQLANFWQDVARDFAIGRVYIPAEDLNRFGVTDDDIAVRRCTPAFRELLRFEVERTRGFFDRGEALLPLLPREARVDVDLFIRGGRAILRAIERGGYDVLSSRPEVTKFQKVRLLLGALARHTWW